MAEEEEVVEPLHLDFEDREVYLAKIPVRRGAPRRFLCALPANAAVSGRGLVEIWEDSFFFFFFILTMCLVRSWLLADGVGSSMEECSRYHSRFGAHSIAVC